MTPYIDSRTAYRGKSQAVEYRRFILILGLTIPDEWLTAEIADSIPKSSEDFAFTLSIMPILRKLFQSNVSFQPAASVAEQDPLTNETVRFEG